MELKCPYCNSKNVIVIEGGTDLITIVGKFVALCTECCFEWDFWL